MQVNNVSWGTTLFISIYQILVLVSVPVYLSFGLPSLGVVISTLVLMILTGISITAGYHRFYAHKAYSTNLFVESILLFFASMSFMGSVFEWAADHRIHHRFVDSDRDPYNIKKGFWHAHMLWIFKKRPKFDRSAIPDLTSRKILRFQHKYRLPLYIITNSLAFLFLGWLVQDFIGILVFAIGLRLFLVHHATWFINSAAHTWGSPTYSKELSAMDNFFLALVTFGEGYHNYHHVFASDYRNGIRWYHFDPTKWLIFSLSKLGLAKNLVSVDKYISQRKIVQEDKSIFLEALKDCRSEKKALLEKKVYDLSEKMSENLTRIRTYISEYRKLKKDKQQFHLLKSKKRDIKMLKVSASKNWKSWLKLGYEVNKIAPLKHHFH